VTASAPGGRRWLLALVVAGSVHLLTTSGNWAILDHGEILYTARHLLHHGTFDLAPAGVPRLKFMPTVAARPGYPVRSRFLPIPTLTLVPLLFVDERLGWADDRAFGHVVHLQGHAFVLAGLALLGLAVRRRGGGDSAAAAAVLLGGLAWPVWLVSRRVGPEPVLIFLVCAYMLGEATPSTRGSRILRTAVCLLLPWTHATGPQLSVALILASSLRIVSQGGPRPGRWRELAPMAAATLVGTATMVYFWNYRLFGNWSRGGYAITDPAQSFGVHGILPGVFEHVTALALLMPVTLPLAFVGLWRAGRGAAAAFWPAAVTVTAVLILMFATFYSPEPPRRLAVACPAWAGIVGSTWDRLRLRTPWGQAAIALQGLCGFAWFIQADGGWGGPGPGGLNLPQYVLWADLLRAGQPWWTFMVAPVALLIILILASGNVWALLRSGDAPRLDRAAATL
jgi:hypothetical protein